MTKQLQECEGVGEKVLRKTFGIDVNAQIGMYMYFVNVCMPVNMVICYNV